MFSKSSEPSDRSRLFASSHTSSPLPSPLLSTKGEMSAIRLAENWSQLRLERAAKGEMPAIRFPERSSLVSLVRDDKGEMSVIWSFQMARLVRLTAFSMPVRSAMP